jgi:formate dehydrogenase
MCAADPDPDTLMRRWPADRPIRDEYLIVDGGALAGTGAHSYSVTK